MEDLRTQTTQKDGGEIENYTSLVHNELQRRAEADHKIYNTRKDPLRKGAEEKCEKVKREKWDNKYFNKQ